MARWLLVALVLAAAPACSKASKEAETKQWPDKPPPKDMPPPADLKITIKVNGAEAGAITADTLKKKPDFEDAERSAWLISTLVPEAAPNGTTVEAVSPAGVSLKMQRPGPTGLEPVLFLTRRGEVIVSAIDPKDPFPRYHGQGGRLHRAGDSLPHVGPVARLEITRTP